MNWLNHLSGGSCGGGRAILPPFPRITVASHPTYGTIAPAFTESCPSGRRSTIGNRVGAKSVSRVQIPDSPPELSAARIQLDGVPFSLLNGGVAEWLNAAVSKTVYGYSPYEGSNPSSSAIFQSRDEPGRLVFLCDIASRRVESSSFAIVLAVRLRGSLRVA